MSRPLGAAFGAALALACATAVGASTIATAAPGAAAAGDDRRPAATSYVALGDSYSSGTGTRTYYDDGTECERSPRAYPALIAAAQGDALNFRACSGATTSDVTSTQLSALSAGTGRVSISVGGNDAGFADVLTECALPAWASDCNAAIDGAQAFVGATLPGRLSSLYADIAGRAPSAEVVVVGYPRIFMGEDCNAATFFSPEEESRLNATADQLNSVLSSRASAAGFSFANPTSRFIGHAVCDDPEWLNGFSNPVGESYHPNVTGHASGYTPAVSPYLGARVVATPAVRRQAAAEAAAQARLQRTYADRDRRIEPKRFVAPDLHSPRVLAAAKRIGIDVDDRAAVERADRRWSKRQAR